MSPNKTIYVFKIREINNVQDSESLLVDYHWILLETVHCGTGMIMVSSTELVVTGLVLSYPWINGLSYNNITCSVRSRYFDFEQVLT